MTGNSSGKRIGMNCAARSRAVPWRLKLHDLEETWRALSSPTRRFASNLDLITE